MLINTSDPGVECTLIMQAWTGCGPSKPSYYPGYPTGFFYAPFAMERFTQDLTPPGTVKTRTAKIYWLLSTWNPYQVIVMQSTLQFTPK